MSLARCSVGGLGMTWSVGVLLLGLSGASGGGVLRVFTGITYCR